MIVVDTNVLTELMRPIANPSVVVWLDAQDQEELAITAITVAEVLYGLHRLADGRRKAALFQVAAAILERFGDQTLPFDVPAAQRYATIVARRRTLGRPIQPLDAQIAAIAAAHNAAVASRDGDFSDCGIPLIDPWGA